MSRRLLAVAVALSALVLLLDLSGALDLAPVRETAAAALGPVERAVGPRDDEASRLREENTRLRSVLADAHRQVAESAEAADLLSAPGLDEMPLVLARVVAVGRSGPAGPERVTIDVGSRDGVEVDRAVVAADGLVGRVVAVAPWTSDVVLVGGPEVSVGVRVGPRGVLGQASGAAAVGAAAPRLGTLSLGLVERGTVSAGDDVVTLGSVGGRPFVPGIPVGTVTQVGPAAGRLAPTGVLTPAVDTTALDVVGVLVPDARSTPRPTTTGEGG